MYADTITGSIKRALEEMNRRREKQLDYNKKNGITPKTIVKAIREEKEFEYENKKQAVNYLNIAGWDNLSGKNDEKMIKSMERDMEEAADMLDFELAAAIRDKIYDIKNKRN